MPVRVTRVMLALVMLLAASYAPLAGATAQESNVNAALKTAKHDDADVRFKLGLMTYLGLMYYQAEGAFQDYGKAHAWFQKAAEQGYAQAQRHLGTMYRKGLGVAQDNGKAREWYKKAAEQDDFRALLHLSLMCALGRGGPRDLGQAMKWVAVGTAQGARKAVIRLDGIVRQKIAALWLKMKPPAKP